MSNRLIREQNTIEKMIIIYCTEKHKSKNDLCTDCKGLLQYAVSRLNNCTFGEKKPVCGRCTIHCYKQELREKIKKVMRYSGKRMLMQHPVLTVQHFIDMLNYRENNDVD